MEICHMKDEENMNSKISFYIFKTKIIKLKLKLSN